MSRAKRQPAHHCPACHRYSACAREQWMPACPIPTDIICGSCAVRAQRLIALAHRKKSKRPKDKKRKVKK